MESVSTSPFPSQSEQTLELFNRAGAYLKGHFKLTSGLHSPEYLQCALVLQHPKMAEFLGSELAKLLQGKRVSVSLVASPAIGGMVIGHEVARALNARHVFTERDPATRSMQLRRGFHIDPADRVVVIEDVITTGGSTREVIEIVQKAGAEVAAAGSIIDRSGGRADLGVPRVALATMNVIAFAEDVCPMCAAGQPVQKPGSRPSA